MKKYVIITCIVVIAISIIKIGIIDAIDEALNNFVTQFKEIQSDVDFKVYLHHNWQVTSDEDFVSEFKKMFEANEHRALIILDKLIALDQNELIADTLLAKDIIARLFLIKYKQAFKILKIALDVEPTFAYQELAKDTNTNLISIACYLRNNAEPDFKVEWENFWKYMEHTLEEFGPMKAECVDYKNPKIKEFLIHLGANELLLNNDYVDLFAQAAYSIA